MGKTFQNFKDVLKEWCQVTTCAGVVDWHLARTFYGKAFWIILLLIFLGLTIFQTTLVISQFSTDNPFQTTLTVKSDPVFFPNVTLCNVNRINVKLLGEFENDTDMLSYAILPSALNYFIEYDYSKVDSTFVEERWTEFKEYSQISNLRDMFRKFGTSCEEMFVSCKWGFDYFDCCKYASEIVSTYGRCWMIQPPSSDQHQPAVQQRPGIYYGLQVVLTPNLDQYVRNLVVNNFIEEGFFLDIGYVQESYINNFKALQPATHSWISMKATKQSIKFADFQLFKPKCQNFRKFKYIEAQYTTSNCETECLLEIQYEFCNCTSFTRFVLPKFMICSPQQMINCVVPLLYEGIGFEKYEKCSKNCIPSCDPYWLIETSQTSTTFIGDHVKKKLGEVVIDLFGNITNIDEKLHSAICLNVFFETLDYVEKQLEEANPIFVFIGNIGGQLSLWLGISLVTIIQAWYYMLACCCSKNFEKRKVLKVKPNLTVNKSKM